MFYRLRHTFVAVPLDDGALLFKSDTRSFKVEGAFATVLSSQLLPRLNGHTPLDEIARTFDLPVTALQENLDALVGTGVLERSDIKFGEATPDARLNLAETLVTDPGEVTARLAKARIVVFGLEGIGELIAEQLAMLGFQRLLLVDPFGPARDRTTADHLQARFPAARIASSDASELDRHRVLELSHEADLLIACWDRGYEAGNYWVNRASVELNIPSLYCWLGGVHALAGPFVVPGMTACYMCAKMRSLATSDTFSEAMACERFFDQLKKPGFAHREFFPSSLSVLAGLLVTDAYKYIVLQYQPALLGQVIEFDPMALTLERHAVLEQPQCPVCSKKKTSHVVIPAWRSSTIGATMLERPSSP
jgi:bacteriocin biosynthesis cyclodehydratase domain-containing protein